MVDVAITRATARATMKDVAARAGVSLKTVSRVINGEPSVNAELSERVRQAASELHYQPNIGARSLRRLDRRSMTIGALLGDLANPYSAMILRAIETVAAERHVLVLGASINENAELEHEVITAMSRHRTDGMVVVPVNDDDSYLQQELNAGVSIVYIDRPPINLPVDSVVSDSFDASRDGTVHLINHGHRRIGYLGDLVSIQTAVERHRGYKEALQENGIAYDEALVTMNLRSESDAFEALVQLMQLSDPPTAVFTSQNLLTIGAVEALQTLGLQRSVALIGYDDFSLANLLDPGVTVIAQDTMAIGLTAATLLFERIDGYDGPPRAIVLPTTLIPRGSGEIRR